MRRQGSSRMDNLEEEVLTPSLGMELVGMPEGEDGSGLHHFSNPGNGLPSSALFLDDGDTEVDCYLPKGGWLHLFSDSEYNLIDEGKKVRVDAPIGMPAVFYRKDSESSNYFKNLKSKGSAYD